VFGVLRQHKPRVLALLPAGERGCRKRGVRETSYSDAKVIGSFFAVPVHGRAAGRAEVEMNRKPAIGDPAVDLAGPFRTHLLLEEIRAGMKNCAGAALARLAVTHIRKGRFPGHHRPKRTAMALRNPFHGLLSPKKRAGSAGSVIIRGGLVNNCGIDHVAQERTVTHTLRR
jgi:hypothetical protein